MNYKTSVEENDDGFCLQGNHNKSSAPISWYFIWTSRGEENHVKIGIACYKNVVGSHIHQNKISVHLFGSFK